MKKKIVIILALVVVALGLLYFIGTGFMEQTSVVLNDYNVSEDGKEIVFDIALTSSMGYVRDYKDKGGGAEPHYLHFYSAFGGLNSSLDAKNEFVLKLEPNDTEIYFSRGNGEYALVLKKNEQTDTWEKAQ